MGLYDYAGLLGSLHGRYLATVRDQDKMLTIGPGGVVACVGDGWRGEGVAQGEFTRNDGVLMGAGHLTAWGELNADAASNANHCMLVAVGLELHVGMALIRRVAVERRVA
ncbi:MAG: hypothetical protein KGL99_09275 [Burkholderiales bacterium]|nr:hypothetical protein [Burkholderiales bacterium]